VHFRNNAKYSYNIIFDSLVGLNAEAIGRSLTDPGDTKIYKYSFFFSLFTFSFPIFSFSFLFIIIIVVECIIAGGTLARQAVLQAKT